ncbi:transporter [Sulfuricaulis limicola]|uniref:Transporter n=2 Tax=Sulfuricaulis limicola TaxID=1620215 RepID=A0A1B4XHX7_9GAMM|nr:transporter [Sulfuricaulis limicola]
MAALLASMGAGAEEASSTLTLPGAIRQALDFNPQQVSQRLEVAKSENELRAARGAKLPSVDLTASATRYGYPTFVHSIRELGTFPPLDDTIYDYGVALKLPLYTGGKLSQGVVLADLTREISLERERLGVQELSYNVSTVYLKIEQLAALGQAYDARIESLDSQEQRIALLRRVGRAAKLDYLKVHGQLTKARHDRLQIENRRQEARSLLYQLMGRERPAQETPLARYEAAPAPARNLEEVKQQAFAQHPELRIAEQQSNAGAAQEAIARGERYPALSLVGGYGERRGGDTSQFYEDWAVGLQFSVPLLDGGVRRARVDEAVLAREQARQGMEQARLEVAKQVQDAWDAQAEAESRLQVTGTSIEEATEALAIEKLKVEQGVGVITDLLNAESALLTAQADRLQAQFDLIVARLGLLRATGTLDPERVAALLKPQSNSVEEHEKP